MDLRMIKKKYSNLGWRYLAGTLFTNIFVYVVMYIASQINPDIANDTNISILVQMLPRFLICYPVFAAIIMLMPKMKVPEHKLGAGKLTASFFMAYSAAIISNVFALAAVMVFSIIKRFMLPGLPGSGFDTRIFSVLTNLNPWLQLVFVVILAPICEELLYRKLLIDRIFAYGEGTAIILSGLMFGLFHGNLQQCIYATVIGMFFAYIYVRTGRVRYTIILHMIVNSIGSLVAGNLLRGLDFESLLNGTLGTDESSMIDFYMNNGTTIALLVIFELCIGAIILTGVILWIVALAKKKFFLVHYVGEVPKGKRFSTAFLCAGIIIYIVVYIIEIVYSLFTS